MARRADTIEERTLPHNLDAERAVLGAILIHNDAYLEAIRFVRARDFYRRAHQIIFAAMAALLEQPGGAVDFVTLKDQLQHTGELEAAGGAVYLTALTDGVPRSSNVAHYAGIVRQKSQLRQLIRAADKILSAAYADEETPESILNAADRAIVTLQHGASNGRMRELSTLSGELLADLEFRVEHRGELFGVETGFPSINDLTGGWQAGDMIVIAARPSIGKTTFVLNSALAAAETLRRDGTPRRVAIFSLEMRLLQLQYRLLSTLSGVSLSRLTGGYLTAEAPEWPAITAAFDRMQRAALAIDDTGSRTVWDIRAECRRRRAAGGLDLVIVDYVQLMEGSLERRGATKNEEITDISRRFKVLADELACPVIVVSQLTRASEGRADPRPKLHDLRESGALEQDADLVSFLHRRHHREGGSTEFIVEKQRNGPTGTAILTLTQETTTFVDGGPPIAEPTEAERDDRRRARNRRVFAERASTRFGFDN